MEKGRESLLSEIAAEIEELKARIASLEERLTVLSDDEVSAAESPAIDETAVDLGLDDFISDMIIDEPAADDAPKPIVEDTLEHAVEDLPEPEDIPEPQIEDLPETLTEDLPETEQEPSILEPEPSILEPEPSILEPEPQEEAPREVPQTESAPKNDRTYSWETDMPGSAVKNIISAISLNDRVLFINTLFAKDPMLFQTTITDFNAMESFADAKKYISTKFPSWKQDSEVVYRLMMAVRRKLQ